MCGPTAGAGLTLLGHVPHAAVRRRLLRSQNRVSEVFKQLTLQWLGIKVTNHIRSTTMFHGYHAPLNQIVDKIISNIHMPHTLSFAGLPFCLQEDGAFIVLHDDIFGRGGALRL